MNLRKQKRALNQITWFIDDSRNIVEDVEGLVAIPTINFKTLSEYTNPTKIDSILLNITSTITNAMNEDLIAQVTEWEVKLTHFAMYPKKAFGPDGMSGLFY